jgi:hypothetical protein
VFDLIHQLGLLLTWSHYWILTVLGRNIKTSEHFKRLGFVIVMLKVFFKVETYVWILFRLKLSLKIYVT